MILSHIYRYTLTFWLRQFDRVSIILPSIFQSKFPLIFLIKSINQSFLFVVVMSAKKCNFYEERLRDCSLSQTGRNKSRQTNVCCFSSAGILSKLRHGTACNTAIWTFSPYFCDKHNIFTQSCLPRLMNMTVPTKIL